MISKKETFMFDTNSIDEVKKLVNNERFNKVVDIVFDELNELKNGSYYKWFEIETPDPLKKHLLYRGHTVDILYEKDKKLITLTVLTPLRDDFYKIDSIVDKVVGDVYYSSNGEVYFHEGEYPGKIVSRKYNLFKRYYKRFTIVEYK